MFTHADELPEAALENIIRFLSPCPHLPEWTHHVPAQTLVCLIRTGGALAGAAKEIFTNICIEHEDPCRKYPPCPGTIVPLSRHLTKRSVEDIIEGLGGSLSKLHVCDIFMGEWMATAVAVHASGLRQLTLQNLCSVGLQNMPLILAACGSSLEVLTIQVNMGEREVSAVATHCHRLRRAVVRCRLISSSLEPMWCAMGSTLEDVTVQPPFWDRASILQRMHLLALPALARECRNVTQISLYWFRYYDAATYGEQLCVSYGAALLKLVITTSPWPTETLRKIIAACPNVSIDFLCYGGFELPVSQMLTMGPHASALVFSYTGNPVPWTEEQLVQIGKACPNVREYILSPFCRSEFPFEFLFVEPKPFLTKVDLDRYCTMTGIGIFKTLAEHVTTLVELTYRGPCPPLNLIRKFVCANKGLLKVTHAGNDLCTCYKKAGRDQPVLNVLDSRRAAAVSAYLESPSLLDFQGFCQECGPNAAKTKMIRKGAKIVEVCSLSRARSINVRVCEVQYL